MILSVRTSLSHMCWVSGLVRSALLDLFLTLLPTGDAPFHPLPAPLIIRPPTLIPRPETEDWVAHLASVLAAHLVNSPVSARPFRILDIGTGTGCIPIGLAFGLSASPSAIMRSVELVGVDITDSAVQLANENVARLSPMLPESTRLSISVHKGDVFADDAAAALLGAEGEGFDLVVSNPPYIAPADFDALDPSVKNWEDRGALVGERMSTPADDEDQRAGLVFYRRIVQLLPKLLRSPLPADSASGNAAPPAVVFEVGAGQAESVKGMLEAATYETEVRRDQWGLDRVVIACRGP